MSNNNIRHPQILSRRRLLRYGLAAGGTAVMAPTMALGAETPNSTHTWFGDMLPQIYSFDVDMQIEKIPTSLDPKWLYFPSLQVNFDRREEWAHGGVQWASGRKRVNWGGGSDAGYGKAADGSRSVLLDDFEWSNNTWYRYRVWRVEKDDTGMNRWLFTILNYATDEEWQIGILRTVSDWIAGAVVWIETGYGVRCTTDPVKILWRNPIYRCTTPGEHFPGSGTASYNGTCTGSANTNQMLVSRNPLEWVQETNAPRMTEKGAKLWG